MANKDKIIDKIHNGRQNTKWQTKYIMADKIQNGRQNT